MAPGSVEGPHAGEIATRRIKDFCSCERSIRTVDAARYENPAVVQPGCLRPRYRRCQTARDDCEGSCRRIIGFGAGKRISRHIRATDDERTAVWKHNRGVIGAGLGQICLGCPGAKFSRCESTD
jgi:hypothetical protein